MANIFEGGVVDGVSMDLLTESIARTDTLLRIGRDRSYFLLLQYKWNEAALRSDISSLGKAAILMNSSIRVERLPPGTRVGACVRCTSHDTCHILSCDDLVCNQCLQAHVRELVTAQTLILSCPNEACNRFLTPSALVSLVPAELLTEYTQLVMRDFIARTRPHPIEYIKRGLCFLWNKKLEVFDCGLIAGGAFAAFKIDNWRKKNPRTFAEVMIICNQVKDGQRPSSFGFWWDFIWKAKFGRR